MKLRDTDWKSVSLTDGKGNVFRTILRKDRKLYPPDKWEILLGFEVKPLGRKGAYITDY